MTSIIDDHDAIRARMIELEKKLDSCPCCGESDSMRPMPLCEDWLRCYACGAQRRYHIITMEEGRK